ncbi:TonB-dependent receptor plug domain-containing protein [Carboxylicivirga linearis]|uniref:TonB-dependent receptor plug domain-containing protein n=1 Tax=Carboxylicivirga linearis TaxID=1628157 RepID=A0ABS5JUT5_9BACT|nr:TonB-dependent receptor plug domain-containing protein [Carboxylicivirga linearis]MBS2098662.1 TonB-dependent receptor plug domain-containing protein [Carboxylicivirga linearis]
MSRIKYILIITTLVIVNSHFVKGQEESKVLNYSEMSLDEMRDLTQDDLLQIPFEDLIELVKRFKVSSVDELYQLILNPSQSTASKKEEDLFESTLATTVISSTELENSGARNIPEALRLAPGIIVREKTNGNYDVHIRGNDFLPPGSDVSNSVNSTTLVMIDNRPVYNRFLGATFWENLPITIQDIEKIEIIYGPATALYGPNAVSGVIHLITKKTTEEGFHARADVQGGSHNSVIGYGNISYSKGKLGLNLSANYQQADRFQDTYYIPQNDTYVSGGEVGSINASVNDMFSASGFNDDYWLGVNKAGLNLGVDYQISDKTQIHYIGSYQNSSSQTSYMDLGSVLSTRESNSFSNNLNLTSGKFDANFSAVTGHLNAIKGMAGYEYDYTEMDAKMGYNFSIKNLTIRPGVEADYALYSDENYVDTDSDEGLLNGLVDLGTLQGSLRLDYTAFEKLRLTGAMVKGYFTATDDDFTSYQFSTSFKANESTLFRAVASKANSGPFVLNTYMNKTINMPGMGEDDQSGGMTMYRLGNKDLLPMEMTMYELGMRKKLGKKLQADLSVFYNQSDNFSQMTKNFGEGGDPGATDVEITESMQNIDLKANQLGATLSLKYVHNEKLNASVFATYQNTKLENFEVTESSFYEGITGESADAYDLNNTPAYLSFTHEYTPKFYGGGYINYQPGKKWNINTSFYALSKQKTFYSVGQNFQWVEIDPKLTMNLKTSYQVNKWLNTYLNVRNVTNSTAQEFLFTDKTGISYLVGCNLTF